MKPPKEDLAPLCATHTMAELAKMYGVTPRSIRNWCDNYGIKPGHRCGLCDTVKPREDCVNEQRCKACVESLKAGTFEGLKPCTTCGEEKDFSEYYLTSSGTSLMSECKTCCRGRWDKHSKEKRQRGGIGELPLPATAEGGLSYLVQGVV